MTAATVIRPALREVILDALEEAYDHHRTEIEACRDCAGQPAGICLRHRADNDAAFEYDDARKQLERNRECPEVLAVLAGGAATAARDGGE